MPIDYEEERRKALEAALAGGAFKSFDSEDDLLKQQMAWAQALAQPSGQRYSTGQGGMFGALGNALGGITGQLQMNNLAERKRAMTPQREAAMGAGAQFKAAMEGITSRQKAAAALQRAEAEAQARLAQEQREAAEWERRGGITSEAEAKARLAQEERDRADWDRRNEITSRQEMERAKVLAGQKAAEQAKAGAVSGLEPAPGQNPSAEDAKKVKASMAAAERMGAYVRELRELHKKSGTELSGPAAARMSQLHTAIKLEGKNIAELGALSGPDMALMESLAGADPSSFGANVKGAFGFDNTQTSLEGIEKWTTDTVKANQKVYGYQPKDGSKAPAVAAPPAVGAGPVKISSDQEYESLPSGASFVGPDGKLRTKP